MLVDFDWSEETGVGRYPLSINMEDIDWPHGVIPNGHLSRGDDIEMLNRLKMELLP